MEREKIWKGRRIGSEKRRGKEREKKEGRLITYEKDLRCFWKFEEQREGMG